MFILQREFNLAKALMKKIVSSAMILFATEGIVFIASELVQKCRAHSLTARHSSSYCLVSKHASVKGKTYLNVLFNSYPDHPPPASRGSTKFFAQMPGGQEKIDCQMPGGREKIDCQMPGGGQFCFQPVH